MSGAATWLGLAMLVMASPPVSGWMVTGFSVTFLLWIVASHRVAPETTWIRLRKASGAILLAMLLVLTGSEFGHRRMPKFQGVPAAHLVVIGDSISAGIDSHTPTWPTLVQRETGIPVKNLSQPGATVADARGMAARVIPQDAVVLIEIGGNDLLSGVPSDAFGRALDCLLGGLAAPQRTLVMFELPLLPHWISYGRIQRQVASRYGVLLIPKRYFAQVLSGANATSDGLHLSATGAERMAAFVTQTLSGVLKPVARHEASQLPRGKSDTQIPHPARRSTVLVAPTTAAWAASFRGSISGLVHPIMVK